jgi:two-component system sensor histidine kinase CreC
VTGAVFFARLRTSLRVRLALAVGVVVLASFAGLAWWLSRQVAPAYAEASEEALVDTAQVLAALCAESTPAGQRDPDPRALAAAWAATRQQPLQATIWRLNKSTVSLDISLTDRHGIVLYDSARPQDLGRDNSRWNDVARTLAGRYGARATRRDPDDPTSAVLHVAAPVRRGDELIGVLTVSKPSDATAPFVAAASSVAVLACVLAALTGGLLAIAVSAWITAPLARLTQWVARSRAGEHPPAPHLGAGVLGRLADDVAALAVEAEGRRYVQDYVEVLTHELKSPLAGIRAAAELLEQDLPPAQRARFLGHLHRESERLGQLAERLLHLAAVERQVRLDAPVALDLGALFSAVAADLQAQEVQRGLTLEVVHTTTLHVMGQEFLVRQALTNLLQNALGFATRSITATVTAEGVSITDDGPGIPAYALPRIGERFYSLARPNGEKGNGLGLPFVRRVAELHGWRLSVTNRDGGGCHAALCVTEIAP